MAATVTIEGEQYVRREPLGVLGLSIITLGIYWFYWYFKVNEEIKRFEKDPTVRPGKALLAVTLGWLIIVPPFISMYNTSLHIAKMEDRTGVQAQISPALNVILLLVVSVGTGIYSQEHLNRVWDRTSGPALPPAPPSGQLPPPPA